MSHLAEELRMATGVVSCDYQARFSWSLAVYAILVAAAVFILCLP